MLRADAVIAYPTDSCYARHTDREPHRGGDRIRQIRHLDDKHHFTRSARGADFAQLGQLVVLDSAFRARPRRGRTRSSFRPRPEVRRRLAHAKKRSVGVRMSRSTRWRRRSCASWASRCCRARRRCPGSEWPMTAGQGRAGTCRGRRGRLRHGTDHGGVHGGRTRGGARRCGRPRPVLTLPPPCPDPVTTDGCAVPPPPLGSHDARRLLRPPHPRPRDDRRRAAHLPRMPATGRVAGTWPSRSAPRSATRMYRAGAGVRRRARPRDEMVGLAPAAHGGNRTAGCSPATRSVTSCSRRCTARGLPPSPRPGPATTAWCSPACGWPHPVRGAAPCGECPHPAGSGTPAGRT